jgi:hypothetical protein
VSTVLDELTHALAIADLELEVVAWQSVRRQALLDHDTRAARHAQERTDRALESLAAEYARARG